MPVEQKHFSESFSSNPFAYGRIVQRHLSDNII